MLEKSPSYYVYIHLLRMLHYCFAGDDPDGPIADFIRDWMNEPWSGMTKEERDLAGEFSERLYIANEATYGRIRNQEPGISS